MFKRYRDYDCLYVCKGYEELEELRNYVLKVEIRSAEVMIYRSPNRPF